MSNVKLGSPEHQAILREMREEMDGFVARMNEAVKNIQISDISNVELTSHPFAARIKTAAQKKAIRK